MDGIWGGAAADEGCWGPTLTAATNHWVWPEKVSLNGDRVQFCSVKQFFFFFLRIKQEFTWWRKVRIKWISFVFMHCSCNQINFKFFAVADMTRTEKSSQESEMLSFASHTELCKKTKSNCLSPPPHPVATGLTQPGGTITPRPGTRALYRCA